MEIVLLCLCFTIVAGVSEPIIDVPPPTNCPGVDGGTCGGLTYEYVKYDKKTCDTPYSFHIRASNVESCKKYCDKKCDCKAIKWVDDWNDGSYCYLYTRECRDIYLQPMKDNDYSDLSDGSYQVKRVKGQPDHSFVTSSTGGVADPSWTTCDGKQYTFVEIPKKRCKSEVKVSLSEKSVSECQTLCSQDCQCTGVQHTTSTCELLFAHCNDHLMEDLTTEGTKLFVRKEKDAANPPNRNCNGEKSTYTKIKDRDIYYQSSADWPLYFTGKTVAECQELCDTYCHCKAFKMSDYGSVRCTLYDSVADNDFLVYTAIKSDYYVKEGHCPNVLKQNCEGKTFKFPIIQGKICKGYDVDPKQSRVKVLHSRQCKRMCAENCDCAAYVYTTSSDGWDTASDYTCSLKTEECLNNQVDDNDWSYYESSYYEDLHVKKVR